MGADPESLFGGTEHLLELIELIYSSIGNPPLWSTVLDRLGQAAGSHDTFLFVDTLDPAMPKAFISSTSQPESLQQFVSYYASVNILAEPCDRAFAEGEVRYGHWVVSDEELERSEFYNDFFRRFDMHYSFGIKTTFAPDRAPIYLSCQRSKRLPAFTERDGAVLKLLLPHLQRAFALHHQMISMRSGMAALGASLDMFDHAVFGLDQTGRVVLSNPHGEALLRTGDGLVHRDGHLAACSPAQDQHLQSLLRSVLAPELSLGLSSGSALLLNRASGSPPLRVTVVPFVSSLAIGHGAVVALMLVSDPNSRPTPRSALLQALYGLTPTETRVAAHLLQGIELREASERLRMSLETARFHLKRIFAKTGTRRQTELVRLMLSLPGTE